MKTIDHRSYTHNLSSCAIKAWKKIQAWTGFKPMTSAIPVQCSTIWAIRYITNSQSGQLPVGLIAQLVEHCTGIAEVMGLNPVQAWIFFRL